MAHNSDTKTLCRSRSDRSRKVVAARLQRRGRSADEKDAAESRPARSPRTRQERPFDDRRGADLLPTGDQSHRDRDDAQVQPGQSGGDEHLPVLPQGDSLR